MSTGAQEIYDVVGIGFGPSNLSLAIALEEHPANFPNRTVSAAFFERQAAFGWHRNMLLPSTAMQVSFLKDLATFRNPESRFTFVSYLHASGRLASFVNKQNFYPTRQEFHRYLEWAESNFADRVSYGSQVTGVRLAPPTTARSPQHLQVEVQNGTGTRVVNARNAVISTGLAPRMPDGVDRDEHVWHSSEFLDRFRQSRPDELKQVAVVGAGQSGAEITRFLYDYLPHARIFAIIPSYGYSIADSTPFANQVFDPTAVDDFYFGTDRTRAAFWQYHKNTNYSVVDDEVIRDLHQRAYDQEVCGESRLQFLNLTRVHEIKRVGGDTRVYLESLQDDGMDELDVDAIVFATGYNAMDPTGLLGDLDHLCLRDEPGGRHQIGRDYRLLTTSELSCGIYLQGGTEHTHGLTSSLLSNIAVRSGEIADSIVRRCAEEERVGSPRD
ncbi:lysine N(6)-hydroxylase/L-ornithine N(5)-oxygenase family protein [Amycolatopsis sp. cmx-4-68]|uniref:lysine N(6)-hydroxylase/L-ornithine N(5)-oxygenase family protein n=1 Tax=Amycolatopsis sp. cmx-4-68 TaxID=2790938 RepID=UPI00397879F9